MKFPSKLPSILCVVSIVLAAATSGCVNRRIAWSPDGAHAALFAGPGLYLCQPDGSLSGPLVPGEGMAQWFADSRRLAILSVLEKQSWDDLVKALPQSDIDRVLAGATNLLASLKAGHEFNNAFNEIPDLGDNEKNAAAVYLARSFGTNWPLLLQKEAGLEQVRIGTMADGKMTVGPPLLNTLRQIFDVRVSPSGAAIAIAAGSRNQDDLSLFAIPTDGSTPMQLVADKAGICADWSPNSRSLVFVRPVSAAAGNDLRLGSLSRREVINATGKIEIQRDTMDLAGLLFDPGAKVRCLPDGRIIFAAVDIHLPCTTLDMPQRPQLFALDLDRQPAVVPLIPLTVQEKLPQNCNYYEPSPDGKRIAISAAKGGVVILTLATGDLTTVQADGTEDLINAPDWRSSTELSYISTATNQPPQLVLWNNGTNRILSAVWPAEIRKGFLDK